MKCIKNVVNFFERFWPVVLTSIITLVIYFPAIFSGYFADDFHFLNRYTTGDEPFSYAVTRNTDGTVAGGSWRPLTAASLHVSMRLFHSPIVDHGISLAIYIGIIFVWYALLCDFFPRISKSTQFVATLVMALLPIHAEAVIWVGARADLLAALFGLSSILLFRKQRIAFAVVCFICSLLSKEFWILLPAVWALDIRRLFSRAATATFWTIIGAIIFVWMLIRHRITQYGVGGYSITAGQNVFGLRHIFNELVSFTFGSITFGEIQAKLITWFQNQRWLLGGGIMAFWYATLGFFAHKRRELLVLLGGFIATLLPSLLLSTSFVQPQASVAEQRYWFAPSLFLGLLLVGIWDEFFVVHIKKWAVQVAASVICGAVIYGLVGNVQIFIEAGHYRDRVISGWKGIVDNYPAQSIVAIGLPDTWHGVHIAASPFFEEMLRSEELDLPRKVETIYQWCGERCVQSPGILSRVSDGVELRVSDPRLFQTAKPGFRYTVVEGSLAEDWVGMWTGADWMVMLPEGVEK